MYLAVNVSFRLSKFILAGNEDLFRFLVQVDVLHELCVVMIGSYSNACWHYILTRLPAAGTTFLGWRATSALLILFLSVLH